MAQTCDLAWHCNPQTDETNHIKKNLNDAEGKAEWKVNRVPTHIPPLPSPTPPRPQETCALKKSPQKAASLLTQSLHYGAAIYIYTHTHTVMYVQDVCTMCISLSIYIMYTDTQ